jgi:ATP-dependent HslUV protease ATP-binding subunit HslU
MEEMTQQLQGMFQNLGRAAPQRKLKIKEALKLLVDEEASKMINEEELKLRAVENAEQNGIVFIDEIDKIARRQETAGRRRVARGCAARPAAAGGGLHGEHQVRHGEDRSCAVHRVGRLSHVQALRPDSGVAGPLPIRVELDPWWSKDFVRILTEPDASCAANTRRCWPPRD